MDIDHNRVIGHGSFGKVVQRGQTAVKHFYMETMGAFVREVAALNRLNHKNIQKVLHVCYGELVMPLCGCSLRHIRDISKDHMKQILKQSISAVTYIHSQGFWHRDISPSNILVQKKNSKTITITITDMNTCIRYNSDRVHTLCPTTYWYAPPEMLAGITSYTQSVDIWSLGMTLLEVFSFSPLVSCCINQKAEQQKTTILTQIMNKIGCINNNIIPGIVESDIFRNAFRRASPSYVCNIPDVPEKYTLRCMLQIKPEARSFNRVHLIDPPPPQASVRLSGYGSTHDRELVAVILAKNCIEMRLSKNTLENAIEIMDDCTYRECIPTEKLGIVGASALYLAHLLCEADEWDETAFVFSSLPRLFKPYTRAMLIERIRLTMETCDYKMHHEISVTASEFVIYIWQVGTEMINSDMSISNK